MHELCEPFSSGQIGSSAMAYKQNPIKCENVCSLARHIISITMTAKMNVCTQWLERSLDDSANRRIIIPEAFILTDHILNECIKIIQGLTVNEGIINRHIKDNTPFVAMESIIMDATKASISRQEAHSRIRDLSVIATNNVLAGGDNNLLELIKEDEVLGNIKIDINPDKMIGMAKRQVEIYLRRLTNESNQSDS
jgi:adenylosuccinate lyase